MPLLQYNTYLQTVAGLAWDSDLGVSYGTYRQPLAVYILFVVMGRICITKLVIFLQLHWRVSL